MGMSIGGTVVPVSKSSYARQTSVTAGQVIAQITGLPAGVYDVGVSFDLGGASAFADTSNIHLRVNGILNTQYTNSDGSQSYQVMPRVKVQVPDNSSISVNATAAGTVAITYDVTLTADKIG